MNASELFEGAINWLQENYASKRFYVERDVVWTVQERLAFMIDAGRLPYRVFNDFGIVPGKRRSICADLVLVESGNLDVPVELAAEFKYEPSHSRIDIRPGKLPVISWGATRDNLRRVQQFVAEGRAKVGYSVVIDEGGHYRNREPNPGCRWIDWPLQAGKSGCVSVLWDKIP